MQKTIFYSLASIVLGMLIQVQLFGKGIPELFSPAVSGTDVNEAANRFQADVTITSDQKVFGATFTKDEAMSIINNANSNVYVRLGLVNSKMTIYLGNDVSEYIKPNVDGYCPKRCGYE